MKFKTLVSGAIVLALGFIHLVSISIAEELPGHSEGTGHENLTRKNRSPKNDYIQQAENSSVRLKRIHWVSKPLPPMSHTGSVTSSDISKNERWALTGSSDRTIKMWDLDTGREIRTLKGHKGTVWSVVFSSDGKTALSGSSDKKVVLWDLKSGARIRTFSGHSDRVYSVAFSPDGRYAFSGSRDKSVFMWEVSSGRKIKRFRGHDRGVRSLAISKNGKWLVTGSFDKKIILWEIESGDKIRTLTGHKNWVGSVKFIDNDRRIISGSFDHTIRIWDRATGASMVKLTGHKDSISSISVSPDSQWLISGSYDKKVKLWNLASGRNVKTFTFHSGWVTSISLSNSGKTGLSGSADGKIYLYDLTRWAIKRLPLESADIVSSEEYRRMFSGSVLGAPYPIAKVTLQSEVNVGSLLPIKIEVKNRGKGPTFRLKAIIKSDAPFLNNFEVPFGTVDAKQTVSVTPKIYIPLGTKPGTIKFTITWKEQNDFFPAKSKVKFILQSDPAWVSYLVESGIIDFKSLIQAQDTVEVKRARNMLMPVLGHAFQVMDDDSGDSVGNGDGVIQKGETVDLLVTIKNVGKITARNLRGSLKGKFPKGVVALGRSFRIAILAAGESTTKRLTIAVKRTVRASKIPLILHVESIEMGKTLLRDTIVLAVDQRVPQEILNTKTRVRATSPVVTIFSATDRKTEIARIKAGVILEVSGEISNLWRVKYTPTRYGWIEKSKTREVRRGDNSGTGAKFASGTQIIQIFQKQPPTIALDDEIRNTTLKNWTLSGFVFDDKAVVDVKVTINGVEATRGIAVKGKAGALRKGRTKGSKTYRLRRRIALAFGENRIRIVATDDDGKEAVKAFTITRKRETGQIWAVVIGINEFENVAKLKYAAQDARAFAQYLREDLGVPAKNIVTLTDKDATLRKVRWALLTDLNKKVKKNDQVMIFWAGHGVSVPDDTSEDGDGLSKYILTVDSEMDDLESTALPMSGFTRVFQKLKAERVVFFADTCFSGASGGRTLLASLDRGSRGRLNDDFLAKIVTRQGRIIISASKANQLSQEDKKLGHGVFTYFLLKGLRGGAEDADDDGMISTTELMPYLQKEVSAYTETKQEPDMKGEGSVIVGRKL